MKAIGVNIYPPVNDEEDSIEDKIIMLVLQQTSWTILDSLPNENLMKPLIKYL